ncbi:retrovirus-related pol polyprotein from transposon TNT 1-94 [Tanacetum coccineum]
MWNDLILAHEGPTDTGDTKIAALRLKFNAFKSLEAEVNATFVNSLPRKWLSMNQTQRANKSIKNDSLATLYGKYNYEEGLIDQIYELETQRTNNEFMADLNAEFHERALLANQKRFYKRTVPYTKLPHHHYKRKYKGLKAEIIVLTKKIDDMTKGKSEKGKKDKEKSEKGLLAESFDWDDESVSSDDEGSTKIRAFMAIIEDEPSVGKVDARSGQWVNITMKKVHRILSMTDGDERKHVLDYTHVDLHYVEDQRKNLVSKFNLLKHEVIRINLKNESLKDEIIDLKKVIEKWTCSKRKEKISSKEVVFTKADESSSMLAHEITSNSESECDSQEPLPPLPKLIRAAPSGTLESLISLSDLTLNMADITLDTPEPKKAKPSAKVSPIYVIKKKIEKYPTGPKPCSDKKVDSSTKQLLLTLMEEVKGLKRQIEIPLGTPPSSTQPSSSKATKQKTWFGPCKYCGFRNHLSDDCYSKPKCSTCGSSDHLTKEHLEHAAVKKTLSKLKAYSTLGVKYVVVLHIKHLTGLRNTPTLKDQGLPTGNQNPLKSGSTKEIKLCEMSVQDYLKRVAYVNGLKHNLISISQLCDANYKVLFTKTLGTIYNQNDEVVLIAPRRKDIYVIDMSSFNKESNACFFAKASPSVNWLWHKRLSHLNFKNINNLAKHNLVSGLSSLTFSKDKNCSACEKEKHHRASFKTKRSFSINKSLHLLHMDLFGPVKPQTISHNKYTLVIVDKYSRKMKNLNEVRVKELRSDNGTEFRNLKLEEFCDEKSISQNLSSPCTPEQNGVAKRRNRTLIEAARTMLNSVKLLKQFWGEAVNTACYTQNRSIIVKRHGMTSYDVFRGRSPDISYFHVFGCLVHIHNHRDHLGKFDEKADDGFFLGYSPVAKAFRVFNIRRQEMEETIHVTFSEDDEAISQSSIEGDAINFNENISFPDDKFLEPRNNVAQCLGNTEYFPYIPVYEIITPYETPILQESVIPKDPLVFTEADNHPAINEPNQTESVDLLEPPEPQTNVIHEPISDVQPLPSAEVIPQTLVPQDRWSREKHIELVNIIGEPLAGITTRSKIRDSDATSASECLYVNFLFEMEPKKLIEALKEEG